MSAHANEVAFTQEGALLADTFGLKLLAYLTASSEGAVRQRLSGQGTLEARQEAVLPHLIVLAMQAAAAASTSGAPVHLHLSFLGQFNRAMDTSLGTWLRSQAGGEVQLRIPDDPVGRPLALMLRDIYPLMLLPEDREFRGHLGLIGAVFGSPRRAAFEQAVMGDNDLSRLFPTPPQDASGPTTMLYRSTGSGGTMQLALLADVLLSNSWARAQASGRHDLESVGSELRASLDLVRQAARGEPTEIPLLVAFTGLLLDGIDPIPLPYGTLRPIAEHERALAPRSIEGTLSHTVAEGEAVVISYAGDLVLESSIPYRIRVVSNPDIAMSWPVDLRDFDLLQANLDTTRLAALLAGTADAVLTLLPTWRLTFDPLSSGPMLSWSDPRNLPGLAPRRLTGQMARDFSDLAVAIHTLRRPSFDVAIRRTISGMTGRGDPSDALVDLVICWENLFGSTQGELRLRITAAVAWLLGSSAHERQSLLREAGRIYDNRSAIVHGSAPTPEDIQDSLMEARQITLRLLRHLFIERPDVLAMSDGNARSRALILGN